jgi:hypothetical protein
MIGRRVVGVRRLLYVHGGGSDEETGALELSFDDGSVLFFDVGSDGATVAVRAEAWADPFAEPLSDENREFVRESGKWTAFDVSGDPRFAPLVGQHLEEVAANIQFGHVVAGLDLSFSTGTIHVVVEFDELLVSVTP